MTLYWRVRHLLGRIKRSICLWKKIEQIRNELDLLERNFYYETGQKFRDNTPNVLGNAWEANGFTMCELRAREAIA